jgi:hypothetical protein
MSTQSETSTVPAYELIEALGATTLFECGPIKCEHDYTGSEAVLNERGHVVGATTVCAKCGARAIDEAMWM